MSIKTIDKSIANELKAIEKGNKIKRNFEKFIKLLSTNVTFAIFP